MTPALPLEWTSLAQAWSAGRDIAPALAAISWDRPAMVWGKDESGAPMGRLVHPLSLAFELGSGTGF